MTQTTTPPTTTSRESQIPPASLSDGAKKAPAPTKPRRPNKQVQKWLLLAAAIVAAGIGYFVWQSLQPEKLPAGFTSSNGRIEATEIEIATKIKGRILDELVNEGDFVTPGQVVAHIDIEQLKAQHREALAKLDMAKSQVKTARSTLAQRQSEKEAAEDVVAQRQAELDLSIKNVARGQQLVGGGGMSKEDFDTRVAAQASPKRPSVPPKRTSPQRMPLFPRPKR